MLNKIYFGDNLPILRALPAESVDLIYIDPPFNTGKIQKRTTIRTVRDANGDRIGFQGRSYRTVEVGTKAYPDSFDYYVEDFLKPRLQEAHRILKSHGSLYFHIDYREVHYCKVLLDSIFGRDHFMNEIIWAYDFGGRAKSRWPAKHDNILFYVKDPDNYVFNTSEIDRERYMAPDLVGPEKAKRGKLPTDAWWWPYVGKTLDTWWQTIVPTNSRERTGYPTQKPRQLTDRILRASSHPGNVVLDFFAGSGTAGASCLRLRRRFILIDNNLAALQVMARRFSAARGIHWIGFDPKPYQRAKTRQPSVKSDPPRDEIARYSSEFQALATTATYLQKDMEAQTDYWKGSPFEWVLQLSAAKKGMLGRKLVRSWCEGKGLDLQNGKTGTSLNISGRVTAVKMSTRWADGKYKFQQIRMDGYDLVVCLGISPFEAHCWAFERAYALKHATPQHKGAKGAEYWIAIDPKQPPAWAKDHGGTLDQAYSVLRKLKKAQPRP